jgi:hypothetical protein
MEKATKRSVKYKVEICGAGGGPRGVRQYYYPSEREELVKEARQNFVAEGQGVFLGEQTGVIIHRPVPG